MGSVHVRNLAQLIPEANLVAICDIRLEVAQAVADEWASSAWCRIITNCWPIKTSKPY